jgi:hypothetical protein
MTGHRRFSFLKKGRPRKLIRGERKMTGNKILQLEKIEYTNHTVV